MSLVSLLNESPDELLYGKAGYLYALLFVNKHICGKEIIPANHIEKVPRCLYYLALGKNISGPHNYIMIEFPSFLDKETRGGGG